MSSLKSQLIPEELRSTIMSFFRIPINLFAILSLLLTNWLTTYQICAVACGFMTFGFLANLYLIWYYEAPDTEKRQIVKVSALHGEDADENNYKVNNEFSSKNDQRGMMRKVSKSSFDILADEEETLRNKKRKGNNSGNSD